MGLAIRNRNHDFIFMKGLAKSSFVECPQPIDMGEGHGEGRGGEGGGEVGGEGRGRGWGGGRGGEGKGVGRWEGRWEGRGGNDID